MPHGNIRHEEIGEGHVYEDIMQLVDWVGFNGKKPLCSAEHARHVLEIIDGCYLSIESGARVKIESEFPVMDSLEVDENLERHGGKGKPVFAMPNTIAYFLENVTDKQ